MRGVLESAECIQNFCRFLKSLPVKNLRHMYAACLRARMEASRQSQFPATQAGQGAMRISMPGRAPVHKAGLRPEIRFKQCKLPATHSVGKVQTKPIAHGPKSPHPKGYDVALARIFKQHGATDKPEPRGGKGIELAKRPGSVRAAWGMQDKKPGLHKLAEFCQPCANASRIPAVPWQIERQVHMPG